jgi:hypothetical protein
MPYQMSLSVPVSEITSELYQGRGSSLIFRAEANEEVTGHRHQTWLLPTAAEPCCQRVCSYYYYYYYYLAAIGLTPGGSSTVHIYTQTVHRIHRTEHI